MRIQANNHYFLLLNLNNQVQSKYYDNMNKRKKSKELGKKKEEIIISNKQGMIKFNFSEDNLKCFMKERQPKTDRKRISNKYEMNLTEQKKYKQQDDSELGIDVIHKTVQVKRNIRRQLSPDPSLQASNLIISQIQEKGLRYQWAEIEEKKTEYSEQQQWRESQFFHKTFSQRSNSSYGKNSYASTIDRYTSYFPHSFREYQAQIMMNCQSQIMTQSVLVSPQYIMADKFKYYDSNVFQINPINIGNDPRTTLMIKNIPNKYTIQDLSHQIDHYFENSYDFLYLPCDIKNNCNVGYGFINFLNTEILAVFYEKFHNKKWIKFRSDKICVLTYARLQGLSSLIEHFQNSKVLNHKDKRYQPIIKDIREYKKIQNLIQQQKSMQSADN